jgi:uncharacterized Fe-S radical SAM superfamily protein PflX
MDAVYEKVHCATYIHTTFHESVSHMTTERELSPNHTIHIYKYNLNTKYRNITNKSTYST